MSSICEWCGGENPGHGWYQITLPDGCCRYPVCSSCVDAAQAVGGGTAFCKLCGKVIPIRGSAEVITWWRRSRWRRKIKITSYTCRDGCSDD